MAPVSAPVMGRHFRRQAGLILRVGWIKQAAAHHRQTGLRLPVQRSQLLLCLRILAHGQLMFVGMADFACQQIGAVGADPVLALFIAVAKIEFQRQLQMPLLAAVIQQQVQLTEGFALINNLHIGLKTDATELQIFLPQLLKY